MSTGPVAVVPRLARARVTGRAAAVAVGLAVLAGLVALRWRAMHQGLLYPDGYQYLLMARGIQEHLQPVATLGPGGDLLAPSPDAAAKPLFPALVALAGWAGLAPLAAARAVAAVAAAAVAPLAGLLALRLGATRAGAILAAVLCLASPALGYWLGFAGPEGLTEALALAAAVALLSERPVLGGILAGLAVTARPELLAVAVAALLAALVAPRLRHSAVVAAAAGLASVAVVLGVLRPPLTPHVLALLAGAAALGTVAAVAVVAAGRLSLRGSVAMLAPLGALAGLAIAHGAGWRSLAGDDWGLLALAATGLAVAAGSGSRAHAFRLVSLVLPLGAAYWWKNPGSERYAAVLVPALAVLAGLGIGRLRPVVLAGAAAVALTGALAATTPAVGTDSFHAIATRLEHGPPGPLVTAAPDAYGVLLPDRAVLVARPGAVGLVLVDGAARAYAPGLRVRGRVVERIPAGPGFLRPDGRLDDAPALVVRGAVVALR